MPSWIRKYIWIWLGLFALVLRIPLSLFPEFTQAIYQNGLFAFYRILWDNSIAYSPIPLVVVLVIALTFLAQRFFSTWANDKKWSVLLRTLCSSVGFLIFWFYFLWGYNYHAPSLKSRLALPESEVNQSDLVNFLDFTIAKASTIRSSLGNSDWNDEWLPEEPMTSLRLALEGELSTLQYPTSGSVRCREIGAGGFMRRMGILGIYLPFVGEGHVDATQTSLTQYFSATHEMSHGYGITDEGEANFAAWLAMTRSKEAVYQYMAQLELMRYLLHDLYRMNEAEYIEVREKLPPLLASDLNLIRENSQQYPGFFPAFSEAMNNLYLQSQGVEAGVDSYGEFVNLALAYSTMNRLTP